MLGRLWPSKRRQEVKGTRALVCGLDHNYGNLLEVDASIWVGAYQHVTNAGILNAGEFGNAMAGRPDAVHLCCNIGIDGVVRDDEGRALPGAEVGRLCVEAGVKLLFIANDNKPDAYIAAFSHVRNLDMVMVLERKGPIWAPFFGGLLRRMANGADLPSAWKEVAQGSNAPSEVPDCIVYARAFGTVMRP
jgi:hypothetical protein